MTPHIVDVLTCSEQSLEADDNAANLRKVAQKITMIYTLTLNPAVDRELTVAAMEFDSVLRASESRIDFGGKGFNVSRLLKGMNEPSTA